MSAETCPDCKAAPGQPCHVPIAGVDTTGWEHDARILATVVRAERRERARVAATRLREAVADHTAEPDCEHPDCLFHNRAFGPDGGVR